MLPRLRHSAVRLLVPLAVLAAGCVGSLEQTGEQFHHRRHGFVVSTPQGSATALRRISIDGATLAFRGPDQARMLLKSRCGKPVATPQLMARHLLLGMHELEIVAAQPVAVAGESGWLQVVDVTRKGRAVRLKTVTVVARGCSFDFVLAAEIEDFASLETIFDAWWSSFQLVAAERPA